MKAVRAVSSPNASSSPTSVTVMSGGFSGSVVDFSLSMAVGYGFVPDKMIGKFVSVVVFSIESTKSNERFVLCWAGLSWPVDVSVPVVSVAVRPEAV